jgi:hypothetical protein
MASILKVDDLRGNTAAGNITITSEGGAATMQLQQGVAKAWLHINIDTVEDSFNIASVADNGTGDHSPSLTNAMSNSHYSACSNIQQDFLGNAQNVHVSSSSFRQYIFYVNHPGSNNPAVDAQADSAIHGDLA